MWYQLFVSRLSLFDVIWIVSIVALCQISFWFLFLIIPFSLISAVGEITYADPPYN